MTQKLIIATCIFLGLGLLYSSLSNSNKKPTENGVTANSAVQIENGVQVIKITAYGGYNPFQIPAKAGIKSRLEIQTKGTYDCSSALVIPSLQYKTNLPPTGKTIIDIPLQEKGSKITGLCGMGMFSFNIYFE